MATPKPFVNIDKLKGRENCREWCFEYQNVLVIETVWAAVSGYPAGVTTSASPKKPKDEKARAIICLTLEPQVKSYVVQTTNSSLCYL
jgi:hypothetical protein